MLRRVIFEKVHAASEDIIQLIPFVHAFYAFESPLFYNHYNCEGDVTIIPSSMGIYEGDPWGGALFALAHFSVLCSIANHFPSCLFISITSDIHIIGSFSIVSFAYEHFWIKLHAIGLSIQLFKCITWSPSNLLLDFNTPSQFTTPSKGTTVLGVLLGTSNFTSSFIKNAMLKDV